jgi:uncharacterized membrane protein
LTIEFKRNLMNKGSFVLGFGLLGAFDGIVFHQLLQWHSVYMHTDHHGQIISDGLFHSLTVITLVIGAVLLWLAGHPSDIEKGKRLLVAGILMGGGTFNLVEGIIDHHILQIHHVKQGDPNELLYDLAFLASGLILLVIGIMINRSIKGRDEISISPKTDKAKLH